MENQSRPLHPSGRRKPRGCLESSSVNQRRENGPIYAKTSTDLTTNTPETATVSPATSRTLLAQARKPVSSGTATTNPTSKISARHVVRTPQGTSRTLETSGTSRSVKTSVKNPKNIRKTSSTSQISASRDSAKNFHKTTSAQRITDTDLPLQNNLQQAPLTVDNAGAFRKGSGTDEAARVHEVENNHQKAVESTLQPALKHTEMQNPQKSKEEERQNHEKESGRTGREGVLQISPVVALNCSFSRQDRRQPGATTSNDAQVEETPSKKDTAQEIECDGEKTKREEQDEETRMEKTEEKREGAEQQDQMRMETAREMEADKEKMQDQHREEAGREKEARNMIKSYKDAAMMTLEDPVPAQTLDTGVQTEVVYEDAEVQAVVEVGNKSSTMSPTSNSAAEIHGKLETACTSLQNGLTQDVNSESSSDDVQVLLRPRFLGPPPYKSPLCFRTPQQYVCHIELELCSQSFLSVPEVTLNEEPHSSTSSLGSHLKWEADQAEKDGDQADKGPPLEVAWDERGMTWEVYGAAVDLESLGVAIQNHLRRKIREHEQRIRELRESISISENSHSNGKGAKNKKRNVFCLLFERSTCCLKADDEATK